LKWKIISQLGKKLIEIKKKTLTESNQYDKYPSC